MINNILLLVSDICDTSKVTINAGETGKPLSLSCGLNKAVQTIEYIGNHTVQFKCCETSRQCKEDTGNISETDNGGENARFSDRQVVQCFNDDFITEFRITHDSNSNQTCYIYKCCNRSNQNKTCYPSRTSSNKTVKALYLNEHPILCHYGYGLANIRLFQKCNGKYQNHFSCTKISTRFDNQGKKYRGSHSGVFLRKGVMEICSKFTGENPCRSAISIKQQGNSVEITLWHECSPVNLLHIFRTPFPRNTFDWLLLEVTVNTIFCRIYLIKTIQYNYF